MTVRVYRSSDVGAPAGGLVLGSVIEILDACLVNGYGSKVAAGWTKPYLGTNTAVYKQGANPSRYLYIDDSRSTLYGGDYSGGTYLYGMESATSITAHTGRFPYTRSEGNSNKPHVLRNDTPADGGAWMVVATENAFYLFTKRASWTGWCAFFFGAIASMYYGGSVNDLGRNVLAQIEVTHPAAGGAPADYFMSRHDNTLAFTSGFYLGGDQRGCIEGGYLATRTWNLSYDVGPGNARISAVGAFIRGPLLSEILIFVAKDELKSGFAEMRGVMPGLYKPLHALADFTPAEGSTVTYASGPLSGKTMECIYLFDGTTPAPAYVEISDTWPT